MSYIFPTPEEDLVRKVLSAPPFVDVEGVPNLRELGGYPVAGDVSTTTKPVIYRSADPSRITEKGAERLRALGIKKVFDLRSPHEVRILKSRSLSIEGVEVVGLEVTRTESFEPQDIAKQLQMYASDEAKAFRHSYTTYLKIGGPIFGTILKHIRDHPDEPCLVHCTAGKDRTGVFSALYLALIGVSDEDIVKDYALTTYGLVPALPVLNAHFASQKVFQDNWTGAINLGKSSPESMRDFLEILRSSEYGGVEEYLRKHAGLSDEDFSQIRQNATVS
ncbi:hypothetical protein EIP91_003988 [Steccherinum ochraceum]|uniref:Tyrosine specific protein phosphatases domain-containing protein n=1 Tax=Steccherinum ochraceum TaxID=92696 RepID=A0A4R0R9N3_9APHY|nr:hypothetical protein EIP91_003988 [Steccherinum ochraceum]